MAAAGRDDGRKPLSSGGQDRRCFTLYERCGRSDRYHLVSWTAGRTARQPLAQGFTL